MSSEVFIRTAGKFDLEKIRQLLISTWHDTYDSIYGAEAVNEINENWHSRSALEDRLIKPNTEFIVADNGTKILGIAFAEQEKKIVQLHQLYVDPDFQGQGVGKQLLQEIYFCFDSAETIQLEVDPQNTGAIEFYKACDFTQTGETQNCGKEDSGIPALVFSRSLDL